jgi:formylglycine-generating enzyme required for sulfatase activity
MGSLRERGRCAALVATLFACMGCRSDDVDSVDATVADGTVTTAPTTGTQTTGTAGESESGDEAPGCSALDDDMACIEAGPFWMGCNQALDGDCSATEFPYHEVFLDRFDIDLHEVTVAHYRACVEDGACTQPDPCNFARPDAENHPINCVDWEQAQTYCAWAGKRLPTEAEWEKAARGTDERTFPWGEEPADCERAVIAEDGDGCGQDGTHEVGSRPLGASPHGALDMVGNVEEWVLDWFDSAYYGESPDENPQGPDAGTHRIVRGGSFRSNDPRIPRVAWRWGQPPESRYEAGGFRCVRSRP